MKDVDLLLCVVRLRLLSPAGATDSPEDYEFSLPSVFARSILTVPWVELGDKVTIHCEQTGYSASVVFHTKVCTALYCTSGTLNCLKLTTGLCNELLCIMVHLLRLVLQQKFSLSTVILFVPALNAVLMLSVRSSTS